MKTKRSDVYKSGHENYNDLDTMRHSAAHLMAAAVQKLWPETKFGIGPTTKNGFYYDFELPVKISEENFSAIEKIMNEIIAEDVPLSRKENSIDEAIADAIKEHQPYKKELLEDLKKKEIHSVSIYSLGSFSDLCKGPHVKTTKSIGVVKLLSVAGAYRKGNEKNAMLSRIYATAFPTQKDLETFLTNEEEAKKRDHRKLGQQLGLYVLTNDVGAGLVLWAPKGATVRREIENLIYSEQTKRGYQHVYTPHIGKKQLWKTSGHWDLYREKMYAPMTIDEDEYLVKPMNCPFHMMIYKSQPRSYKELPFRIAEIASVYRYEKAGELSGMLRVRYITQDDAHIFCTEGQVIKEFINVFDYMTFLLDTFGLKKYYLRLGLRSPNEKYLGNDSVWKKAEEEILKAIKQKNLTCIKSEGDAAFYGPKLDVIVEDALGREWQCGTIQVDFMLPERFGLEYINSEGKLERPVLIHRAPLGSLERWMAILIEHYNGAFPLWLAPIQVSLIPIAERHTDVVKSIQSQLIQYGIRAEILDKQEPMGAKIREATLQKIPYIGIIGDKELTNNTISLRSRSGETIQAMTLDLFISRLKKEIEQRV